jgi:hypothetical protein
MQKFLERTLTKSDRAEILNWSFGLIVLYGSVGIFVLWLMLAGVHLVPDRAQTATGPTGLGKASSDTSLPNNEFSTGMPLP